MRGPKALHSVCPDQAQSFFPGRTLTHSTKQSRFALKFLKTKIKKEVRMRRTFLLAAGMCLAGSVALAQDPAKVDPQHCKVEFENAQVRVLRWHLGPHEKVPMHEHPAYVQISLTDQHVRFTLPDGKTKEVEAKAGQVSWNEAQKHSAENLGVSATENVQVELKGRAHAPAKKR